MSGTTGGWQRQSRQVGAALGPTSQGVLVSLLALLSGLVAVFFPVAGSVGLAGILAAILIFATPSLGVYLVILFTPLTSALPRGALVPGLRANEVILATVLAIFLARQLLRQVASRHAAIRVTALDKAFLVLLLASSALPFVVARARGSPISPDDALVLLGPIQYYLIFRLIIGTISSLPQAMVGIRLLLASSLLVAVIALLQVSNQLHVRELITIYYPTVQILRAGEVGRATSILAGWNELAAYMALVTIVAVAFFLQKPSPISRWWLIVIVGLDVLVMALAGTIAAAVGLVVGLLMLGAYAKRLKLVMALLVPGILAAVVLFWPVVEARLLRQFGAGTGLVPQSFAYRFGLWTDIVFPVLRDNYLFGAGLTLPPELGLPTEESQYLFLLFRGGIPYLAAHLLLVIVAMRMTYSVAARQTGSAKTIAFATFTMLVVLSLMGVSNEYFTYSGVAEVIWIMVALTVTIGRIEPGGSPKPSDQYH